MPDVQLNLAKMIANPGTRANLNLSVKNVKNGMIVTTSANLQTCKIVKIVL